MAKKIYHTPQRYGKGTAKELIEKPFMPIPPSLPNHLREMVEEGRQQVRDELTKAGIDPTFLNTPPTPYHGFRDFEAALQYKIWAKDNGLDIEMIGFTAAKLKVCIFEIRPDVVEGFSIAQWRDIAFRFPTDKHDEWFVPYEPYHHPEE